MKHITRIMGALSVAAMVTGCASASKKEQSAVQTVQSAQERVETTGEYIARAERAMKDFEETLVRLKKDASSSDKIRGKDRYVLALGNFDGRIADTRHQLQELKQANSESWDSYRRRIQSADSNLKDLSTQNQNQKDSE